MSVEALSFHKPQPCKPETLNHMHKALSPSALRTLNSFQYKPRELRRPGLELHRNKTRAALSEGQVVQADSLALL